MLFLQTFTRGDLGLSVVEVLMVLGTFLVKSAINLFVFVAFLLLISKVPFMQRIMSKLVKVLFSPDKSPDRRRGPCGPPPPPDRTA